MVDLTLIGIFGIGIFATFIQSVLPPFYPKIAEEKGVSFFMVGLVFSINPAVSSISSPIFGMLLAKLGRKRVLIMSSLLLVNFI